MASSSAPSAAVIKEAKNDLENQTNALSKIQKGM